MHLANIPSWADGETLFSWSSKTHLLNGTSARHSSMQMYGSYRASSVFDMPCGLDVLQRATGGCIGDSRYIVAYRTSVAGHLPFLSNSRRKTSVDAFVAGKSALGIRLLALRSRGLPDARLRFCRICAEQDAACLGYARWVLFHQLEGTWRCYAHACTLTEIIGRPSAWLLPPWQHTAAEHPWAKFAAALDRAAVVSSTAVELGSVSAAGLRRAALARLTETRLVANPSRLCATDLAQAFDRSQIGLWARQYVPLERLLAQPMWIVSLLQGKGSSHPLKWSLIWAWLWEDHPRSDVKASFRSASTDLSVRESPRQLQLFFSGEADHKTLLRSMVIHAMESAVTLKAAADLLRVSEKVIRQLLLQDPVARTRWELRLWEVRRQNAIDSIRAAVKVLNISDRASLLRVCPVDVHWLQRNDLVAARSELGRIPGRRSAQRQLFDT